MLCVNGGIYSYTGGARILHASGVIYVCPVCIHCKRTFDGMSVVHNYCCMICTQLFFMHILCSRIFGTQFPAMTTTYDKELRRFAKQAAFDLEIDLFVREGVYICLSGPNHETPSESMFLCNIGADAARHEHSTRGDCGKAL